MPSPPSNIRAFVHWKEPTVYAGEEIECVITFKNISRRPGRNREDEDEGFNGASAGATHSRRTSMVPSTVARSRKGSTAFTKPPQPPPPPSLTRATSTASVRGSAPSRGHRPTLSLNVISATGRGGSLQSAPLQNMPSSNNNTAPAKGHVRSLSIMSLGSEPVSEVRTVGTAQSSGKRPIKAHVRSASLQHSPKLMAPTSASLTMPSPRQPSPLYEITTPPAMPEGQAMPTRPPRRRPGTASADSTPQLGRQSSARRELGRDSNAASMNNFKFPAGPSDQKSSATPNPDSGAKPVRSPSTMHSSQQRLYSPRPVEGMSAGTSNLNPLTRVMSETSADGTPRTSSEFYSMSNHSDETLTSELPLQQQFNRLLPNLPHSRQHSRSPHTRPAETETLMMAYVQTMGHFTLDGSLVNTAPFEEVKRKGVQGGGGVVGLERSKRSSGLFGALSWGNIGESLGGLLGGDEMSSMAQMKASAGSKTIPLLSTPQSLLFVDLRLAPGESKSFAYRFALPRGLPPSHRGKTIKVSYYLSLGVQRPEGQLVKSVDVPFRVMGSYNARGDILGHDLMSPYVLLQDAARTSIVAASNAAIFPPFASRSSAKEKSQMKTPKQGLEDFLRYTERLLKSPHEANGVLLSPSSPTSSVSLRSPISRQGSLAEQSPGNIKDAIDLAILRSNLVNNNNNNNNSQKQSDSQQSANRFNITRSGQPVAVLTMLRPAYRLGEAVTGTIDFTVPASVSAPAPSLDTLHTSTYAVLVELESAEHVDSSLALRSAHSISRVTRKVHATARENSLFARQIGFNLVIPPNASPTFETTGVSLVWRLKVEFTTHRSSRGGLGIEGSGSGTTAGEELLEELTSDERGTTWIAKERLPADSFEIGVPLKVYGAVGLDTARTMSEALAV